jgi:DNA-binding NtrC family response regulator
MTGELMSSQLFGHVAGAFTGANCDALGCFRAANHGTLFLDEIGELEQSLQAKLLRVLQERVVTPVGSHQGEPVDVRVVAATNRELRSEVRAGKFREDLYYRLDVVHVRIGALRDRSCDIPDLAEAFLEQLGSAGLPRCSLSPRAEAVLVDFHWPGNVRQLRNVLEQAVIDSPTAVISEELLRRIVSLSFASREEIAESQGDWLEAPAHEAGEDAAGQLDAGRRNPAGRGSPAAAREPAAADSTAALWPTLEDLERQHISRTLERTFNNRSAAARLLGVTRQALLRKMKRYGIRVSNC